MPAASKVRGYRWDEYEKVNAFIRRNAHIPAADFLLRYTKLDLATSINESVWAPYQIKYLSHKYRYSCYNKSRQIGYSFIASGKRLARAMTEQNLTMIMLSFNLEESREKIRYCKAWYEALNPTPADVPTWGDFNEAGAYTGGGKRLRRYTELVRDNVLELGFSNGSRIISHPCRPPRGKSAAVFLDEVAHYQNANVIYEAAQGMITRGMASGRLDVELGSTPKGAAGLFWEVHTAQSKRKYKDFARFDYGWWEIPDLCEPSKLIDARAAWMQGISLETRVATFGTDNLRSLFDNTQRESFEQEFDLAFLDSAYAFLPWDLIRKCYPVYYDENWMDVDLEELDTDAMSAEYEALYKHAVARDSGTTFENTQNAIDQLARYIAAGAITGPLVLGYDVGRSRNASEVTVLEVDGIKINQRLLLTWAQMDFPTQQKAMAYLLKKLPIVRGLIDKGGLGMQLAEWLQQRWSYMMGVHYTVDRKEHWANRLKLSMERSQLVLIPNRDQEQQLHSVRRKFGSGKNTQYVVEETSTTMAGGVKVQHHADKFWSLAKAVSLAYDMIDMIGQNPGQATTPSTYKSTIQNMRETAKHRTSPSAARRASEIIRRKMGR